MDWYPIWEEYGDTESRCFYDFSWTAKVEDVETVRRDGRTVEKFQGRVRRSQALVGESPLFENDPQGAQKWCDEFVRKEKEREKESDE